MGKQGAGLHAGYREPDVSVLPDVPLLDVEVNASGKDLLFARWEAVEVSAVSVAQLGILERQDRWFDIWGELVTLTHPYGNPSIYE